MLAEWGIAGALVGCWLMHKKLDVLQVKKVISIVFCVIAGRMVGLL